MVDATHLAKCVIIDVPGTYVVKALNTTSAANLVDALTKEGEDAGFDKFIVSLAATTPEFLPKWKEVFGEKGEKRVPIEHTRGLYLTASLIKNERNPNLDLPMKGQEIKIAVDFVADREGKSSLRVVSMQVVAAKKAEAIDITKFFASPEAVKELQNAGGQTLTQRQPA